MGHILFISLENRTVRSYGAANGHLERAQRSGLLICALQHLLIEESKTQLRFLRISTNNVR